MNQLTGIPLLLSVLESIDYPSLNKIRFYKRLQDINVEDFLRINACIGNYLSKYISRRGMPIFPVIYAEGHRISPTERDVCCEMIECLSMKFSLGLKYTKTEVVSPLQRYSEKRARFLEIMCIYWQQQFNHSPLPSIAEESVEMEGNDSGHESLSALEDEVIDESKETKFTNGRSCGCKSEVSSSIK